MAKRALGGIQDGNAPRHILYRLLLGTDGGAICGRRNEHTLGDTDNGIRTAGKGAALFAETDARDHRPRTDRMGGLVARPLRPGYRPGIVSGLVSNRLSTLAPMTEHEIPPPRSVYFPPDPLDLGP